METFSVIPSPKVSDTVVEPYNATEFFILAEDLSFELMERSTKAIEFNVQWRDMILIDFVDHDGSQKVYI